MVPYKLSPLQLFNSPIQYLVPLFQRSYVWSIKGQVHPLWLDIVDRANALEAYESAAESLRQKNLDVQMLRAPAMHFLGTILVTDHTSPKSGHVATADVVDGQQRITTLQLLLLAFRDALQEIDDQWLRASVDKYTWNNDTYRERISHYKLWPTNSSREDITSLVEARSFHAVCEQHPIKVEGKGRSKRTITRTLIVEAYAHLYGMVSLYLRGVDPTDPPAGVDELDELLINADSEGEERANVSDQWRHLIRTQTHPVLPYSERPAQAKRAERLLATLTDYFQLIELRLGPTDDAQVIFETLNARGERLTPADLVRNFLFMTATKKREDVQALYDQHWKHFDERRAAPQDPDKKKPFWKQDERQGRFTNSRLDVLMYHYVSSRSDRELMLAHVFEGFKQWWAASDRETAAELGRLKYASETFAEMVTPDRSTRFGLFSYRIRVLDSSTLTPVVLHLREHLDANDAGFISAITSMESYLVRRAVCGLTTKAYNRVFPGLLRALISGGPTAGVVQRYLSDLSGDSQEWPTDEKFRKAWRTRQAYQTLRAGKARMILEALEQGLRDPKYHEIENIPTTLQVEHVLPRGWSEPDWPLPAHDPESAELKSHATLLRESALHTFGNLTLLTSKLNQSLSNSAFHVKRPHIIKSLLALNNHFSRSPYLTPQASWTENDITARGDELLGTALGIWPGPTAAAI